MSREVRYDPELQCDNCDAIGAYDFMGDYLCENCIGFHIEGEEDFERKWEDEDAYDLWDYAG